ncbi:ribonuclease H-like domain-containing protein [Tanacetum coccineum]
MVTRAKDVISKLVDHLSLHTTPSSPISRSHIHALRDPFRQKVMHKFNAGGSLSRYKVRLVANERSQQLGIDCDGTFISVVKHVTICIVVSLALFRNWPIHQLGVKNRSLNGLKQAPCAWFQRFTSYATRLFYRVIFSLHGEFATTNVGLLNYFLGVSSQRSTTCLFLSQATYAEELLEWAPMKNCNPFRTPVNTDSNLGTDSDPVSDPTLYRRCSSLTAYTDVDWASCPVTRRSTSSYCVFLGDNLLSWSAKRQAIFSRSSAEAEYRGVANVVVEKTWLRNLLCELQAPIFTATLVYCDNVSVVYLSNNPIQHQRTKHIKLDIHFVRDFVAKGLVRVMHVPSRYQYADIFTKGLPSALFQDFRSSLNVRRPLAPTVGVY